jgi:hypothetical protein
MWWPGLLNFIHIPFDLLLCGLVLAAVFVSLTLPQAILLWSEPDMEPEALPSTQSPQP